MERIECECVQSGFHNDAPIIYAVHVFMFSTLRRAPPAKLGRALLLVRALVRATRLLLVRHGRRRPFANRVAERRVDGVVAVERRRYGGLGEVTIPLRDLVLLQRCPLLRQLRIEVRLPAAEDVTLRRRRLEVPRLEIVDRLLQILQLCVDRTRVFYQIV